MIAVNIGKIFLKAFNNQYNQSHSAKTFFEQVFVPLFYDHPKYMRSGGNAPFENPKFSQKNRPGIEERRERIANTISKIENDPAGSSAIGFPSIDIMATTSGQVTNTNLHITPENVYYSWIGGGLGIGVQGGLVIYFDDPRILLKIFEGWQIYRNYLEEMPKLRPNQIDTWNGQWLAHVFDKRNYSNGELQNIRSDVFETKKEGIAELTTQKWVKILAGISMEFPEEKLIGYIFSLGQTNTTIGFIPFYLHNIRRPIDYYIKLFGDIDFFRNAGQIEDLLGSDFSLKKSCETGQIGIKAMQPAGMMPFITMRKKEYKMPAYKQEPVIQPKKGENEYDFEDRKKKEFIKHNEQKVSFQTYESWIMATLNDLSLYDKATQYANCLIKYEEGSGKGKKDRINHVKEALQAKNRKSFIDALTTIVVNEKIKEIDELVREIEKMPVDNFLYFLTLIRFRYAFLNQ